METFMQFRFENNKKRDLTINEMASREAMHLPEWFSPTKFTFNAKETSDLAKKSEAELTDIFQNDKLENRFLAGLMIALRGEKRFRKPNMLFVPKGNFLMGSSEEKIERAYKKFSHLGILRSWLEKETPEHIISIKAFHIGKYPVTNAEFLEFLTDTKWPEIPTSWEFGFYPFHKSNHPVYSVTPRAADEYCRWLSKKTNRNFRLPTEAEWEYAASGPQGLEYPWGNDIKLSFCNTLESNIGSSTPVGMFPESNSWIGACDMAGNVEEYVQNEYSPYPNGPLIMDDLLLKGESYRIARGGSFTRNLDLARCKRRHGKFDKDIYVMGFRIAETVDDSLELEPNRQPQKKERK